MASADDDWTMTATGSPSAIDADEVFRALGLLIDPDATHELRGVPSGRSKIVRGSALADAVRAADDLSDNQGVYVTLNPVRPDLNKAAANGDVLSRKHILIDVDPVKPAGHADQNATDPEHNATAEAAEDVRSYLAGLGWPSPIVIDSGNGTHLIYKVDLPNDKLSSRWVGAILKALAAKFDGPRGKVDTKVHNASRITKLPGTWVRKGPNTPERPHRIARIVSVPRALVPVPVELLQLLVSPPKEDPPTPPPASDDWTMRAGAEGNAHDAYGRKAIGDELADLLAAPDGHRNEALYKASWKLGQLVVAGILDETEVRRSLAAAARQIGLPDGEAAKTIESGVSWGKDNPRENAPEPGKAKAQEKAKAGKAASAADFAGKRLIIRASEVVPKPVEWLWPGRIPIGKMTTFAGQGGLGKTFVLCDMAARISVGGEWPFMKGECAEEGETLIISGEDDPDDTLVPRLIEMGADLSKIAFMSAEAEEHFALGALDLLNGMLDQIGPNVRLVAIDPPTSYLGGVDDHKNAELRGLLTPLKRWAAERKVAIVLNNHVNKAIGTNIDAASRVMGSVAWVNAVRAAHMFVKDDEQDKVLFVPIKTNISKRPMGLSYRIAEARQDVARLEWLGEIDKSADDALKGTGKTKRMTAAEFLVESFRALRAAGKPLEIPSSDLFQMAKEHGIGRDAIFMAKDPLCIPKARKQTLANGDVQWIWFVTPDWPPLRA